MPDCLKAGIPALPGAKTPQQEISVVLDRTPFYGEAGGQVGDTGALTCNVFADRPAGLNAGHAGLPIGKNTGDSAFTVKDTKKVESYIVHHGSVTKGALKVGDVVAARVDAERRANIMRNHTATHILHHVLREVLGKHAEQSGSLVAPDRLRFDFTHFTAVKREELDRIEELVNLKILENGPISTAEMSLDEAKAKGAIALFGEKYGERVRMVQTGGYSRELCGGTHCARTGDVGLFKIIAEQSVAAGVRRIEALTGRKAIEWVMQTDALIRDLCAQLDTQEGLLLKRTEGLIAEMKALRKEITKLKTQSTKDVTGDMLANAEEVSGSKIVVQRLETAAPETLRSTADQLRRAAKSVAVVLGGAEDNKVSLLAAMTPDLVKRGLHAGKIAGEIAKIVGGGGGGRPDMAQAGGKDPAKLDEALATAKEIIKKALAG
jgi:alanyl-tRNA synthetase